MLWGGGAFGQGSGEVNGTEYGFGSLTYIGLAGAQMMSVDTRKDRYCTHFQ